MNTLKKTITWVSLFAIAMGFMESAIVIYLRELYYASGFEFPLKIIPPFVGKVEFVREAATVVMLVCVGIIAGKTKLQRFAYFVLAFAIWDLCYYLFLYICLGWPQSLSTWDILFLIPVPWVGPVWAPCLLSVLMIAGSLHIIKRTDSNQAFTVSVHHWLLLIAGAVICIISFMWDYLVFSHAKSQPWSLFSEEALFSEIKEYVPQKFNYPLFLSGFLSMLVAVIHPMIKPSKQQ